MQEIEISIVIGYLFMESKKKGVVKDVLFSYTFNS